MESFRDDPQISSPWHELQREDWQVLFDTLVNCGLASALPFNLYILSVALPPWLERAARSDLREAESFTMVEGFITEQWIRLLEAFSSPSEQIIQMRLSLAQREFNNRDFALFSQLHRALKPDGTPAFPFGPLLQSLSIFMPNSTNRTLIVCLRQEKFAQLADGLFGALGSWIEWGFSRRAERWINRVEPIIHRAIVHGKHNAERVLEALDAARTYSSFLMGEQNGPNLERVTAFISKLESDPIDIIGFNLGCLKIATEAQFSCPAFGPR